MENKEYKTVLWCVYNDYNIPITFSLGNSKKTSICNYYNRDIYSDEVEKMWKSELKQGYSCNKVAITIKKI